MGSGGNRERKRERRWAKVLEKGMMVKEKVRRRLDRKEKEDRRKEGRGWKGRKQ